MASEAIPDAIFEGRFFYNGALQDIEVAVSSGTITAIGRDLRSARKIKLDGAVIPAGIDPHVHFRDPGETWKEDFKSGTLAALYGGTTTILDMPNNIQPITDYSRFDNKLSAVKGKALCDFGLYSMFNGQDTRLIDKRSIGLKVYLGSSTNVGAESTSFLRNASKLEEFSRPVVFHGEDAECLRIHRMETENNLFDHDNSRPIQCEIEAAGMISGLNISRKVMAHVSSSSSLDLLNQTTLSEVTPHHLLLNNSMDLGPWGKCNPPLRSVEEQRNLLQAYLDGRITYVGSDHAPHTEEEKEVFEQAPSGIAGVETRVPLLLALFTRKILPLNRLVETVSTAPARVFNIRKGLIQEGYKFDVITFHPSEERRINQDRLHSLCPISPFQDFPAIFPSDVFISGSKVIENGELLEGYHGEFLY
ncbi:MAG: dihydroorotase [Thermoplasmataceae archaeon]